MGRIVFLGLALVALMCVPALSDPGISVFERDCVLRVTLNGSFEGTYYQVWRAESLEGPYDPMAAQYTLCTGDCYVQDLNATPGQTYYYRFDLAPPGADPVSYGPYPVTMPDTPLGARVWPDPSIGPARIALSLPGSSRRDAPLPVTARIVDLQGRTVRLVHAGMLVRGVTTFAWDGKSDSGLALAPGVYFLRLDTPLGARTTRIVRLR